MNYQLTFRMLGVLLLCFSQQLHAGPHKNNNEEMTNAVFNANGELVITPFAGSSASDFDFLLGRHVVHHKKLKRRLAGCSEWEEFNGTHSMESLLGGVGNLEQHVMNLAEGTIEGMALRLFDPKTRLWNIHWASNQSPVLDVPMVGSFENNMGFFYAKDNYAGKPVLVQFKWDATDPKRPVWSQAFSDDDGKTWEWNWHMHFFKEALGDTIPKNENSRDTVDSIAVMELRNYVIRPGLRDSFMNYFEEHFIQSQEALKAHMFGQYRVKGAGDNFCWMRGFRNLHDRSQFLPAFYYGPFWKAHKQVANSMLANNDNVYLLEPLLLKNDSLESGHSIPSASLIPHEGIAVVDFYISNTRLQQLLPVVAKELLPIWKQCGIENYTLWTSVLEENDFPALPVFQDKNLLVSIRFFKNELAYEESIRKVSSLMTEELRLSLADLITTQHAMILYPSEKTIRRGP